MTSRIALVAGLCVSSWSFAQSALCVTERDCGAGSYCYQNRCYPLPGGAATPEVAAPVANTPTVPAPQVTAPPPQATPRAQPAPAPAAPATAAPAAREDAVPVTTGLSAAEKIRGRFGLGFLGTQLVPVGYGSPTGTADMPGIAPLGSNSEFQQTVSVPTLGGVYWTQAAFGPVKSIGILLGIGMLSTGSGVQIEQPGQNQQNISRPAIFGMNFQVGLPFAVSTGQYLMISLSPEFSAGFTSGIARPTSGVTAPPAALSGSSIRVGARAAAEIFMGFIGLPELSIEAGFRFGVAVDSATVSVGAARYTVGSTLLVTSLEGTPWNVFTSTIGARYYF